MKKKLLIAAIILGACGAVAFPLLNLVIPLPDSRLASLQVDDPVTAAALQVLEAKCVHCHTSEIQLPWYGVLPVAKQILEYDMYTGLKHSDFMRVFFPEEEQPVDQVTLAKIEYTTENRSMPPAAYLLMHWNHRMSADDDAALLAWIEQERKEHHVLPGINPDTMFKGMQPLPESVETDPVKVTLGQKLFHDVRLSKNDTVSCATCHDLGKGGTDQLKFSKGVGNAVGTINSPTVFNSVFQFAQFWDGRAVDLADQADGPVNDPAEMASNWKQIIEKLDEDDAFQEEFLAAYPEGYSKETFTNAIAEYEKTLLTPAPWDDFLKGDESALSDVQKAGFQHFQDLGCYTCHTGVLLGGCSYELMGLRRDYYRDRGNVVEADYGRFNETKDEYDRFRLKTPTLRNIALTFPYFHDGTVETLEEAVDSMVKYQVGKKAQASQTAEIVEFLNSLTGSFQGVPLQ
ncbi:MAG: cytochrome B6 [Candidatus Hydrogenedens sp.]|jgi:cytochrome c peroxidase|nr:cytochrome B6 [Candidatus Hydrogenedens sp.]